MPEIPDIEVFSINLKKRFKGKTLTDFIVVNTKKLTNSAEELARALKGTILEDVYRSGKEFRLKFSNGNILGMHLMLTGDIYPFENKNEQKQTIVEFHFQDGTGFALTDFMKNACV